MNSPNPRTPRRIIRSIFAENLTAKFFALGLAAATVYLVGRELRSTWLDSRNVDVVTGAEERKIAARAHRLVLEPEANVAIMNGQGFPPLKSLGIRIVGPAKDELEFRKRLDLTLKVQSDWATTDGQVRPHVIDAQDISVGNANAEITLLDEPGNRTIWVDTFGDVGDVAVAYDSLNSLLPAGYVFDEKLTATEPATVRLRGPQSIIRPWRQTQTIQLILAKGTRIESGNRYELVLPDELRRQQISIVGPTPVIRVEFKPDPSKQALPIELPEVPVHVLLSRELLTELNEGDSRLIVQRAGSTCRARVRVQPSALENRTATELIESLSRVVYAILDLRKFTTLAEIATATERPVLLLSGLPPGCEFEKLDPEEIPVVVERK